MYHEAFDIRSHEVYQTEEFKLEEATLEEIQTLQEILEYGDYAYIDDIRLRFLAAALDMYEDDEDDEGQIPFAGKGPFGAPTPMTFFSNENEHRLLRKIRGAFKRWNVRAKLMQQANMSPKNE